MYIKMHAESLSPRRRYYRSLCCTIRSLAHRVRVPVLNIELVSSVKTLGTAALSLFRRDVKLAPVSADLTIRTTTSAVYTDNTACQKGCLSTTTVSLSDLNSGCQFAVTALYLASTGTRATATLQTARL
jgi:hypothetical protein